MRATNNPAADGFAWDGTPKNRRPPRALRVSPDSPTKLLRSGQTGHCTACGNRIEWYYRDSDRAVPLHPGELPTQLVPDGQRWHVLSGVARPSQDGSPWCRVHHDALCPATPDLGIPGLQEARRNLALNTRRLLDAGRFTPRQNPPAAESTPAPLRRPAVQLLHLLYLAPAPVDQILCVAQTRTRHRCTLPLLAPRTTPGTWILIPTPANPGHLTAPDTPTVMATYDLSQQPYAEQLRWRAQRCPTHAATPSAADIALTGWEPFDTFLHHQHIHPQPFDTLHHAANSHALPEPPPRHPPPT
ncbi:DUF6083 domain-containing protein [Streptomyces sp. H39-S7]|uniref:DUF6083 domain-containing protein n=1 Tax=Streptomyces sp. H39-S7 TaxID=3004357 RepID=UPI0022AEBCF9|nr:DUF6083 domain-containing protein [Streptomyces sp. H39-S7]MCZ4120221.1 DUF6083 domain-containing protein [Streptomyces sp. H39-S7]